MKTMNFLLVALIFAALAAAQKPTYKPSAKPSAKALAVPTQKPTVKTSPPSMAAGKPTAKPSTAKPTYKPTQTPTAKVHRTLTQAGGHCPIFFFTSYFFPSFSPRSNRSNRSNRRIFRIPTALAQANVPAHKSSHIAADVAAHLVSSGRTRPPGDFSSTHIS